MRLLADLSRLPPVAAVLAVVALALSGCGGPETKGPEAPPAGVASPSRPKPPEARPTKTAAGAGVWTLVLGEALPGQGGQLKALNIYIQRHPRGWGQAFGESPEWNKAYHVVDPSGLVLENGAFKGPVKVTLNPDQWMPESRKAVACTFTLNGQLIEGAVTGTYEGDCGGTAVKGALSGKVEPEDPAAVKTCNVALSIENVLATGEDSKRRIALMLPVRGGRLLLGRVSADLSERGRGTPTEMPADTSAVALTADSLTGDFKFEIAKEKQTYVVTLSGMVVGTHVGGTFLGKVNGMDLPPGVFTGTITPIRLLKP